MKVIFTNGDILGHKGLDGRYYVLGTGKLLPPIPPVDGIKNSQLSCRFRLEMVKKNPMPLSSDAFRYSLLSLLFPPPQISRILIFLKYTQ